MFFAQSTFLLEIFIIALLPICLITLLVLINQCQMKEYGLSINKVGK